jgi:protein O-mannosyl-transferase
MRDRRWAGVLASAIVTHVTALAVGFVWLDHAHLEGKLAIASPARFPSLFTQGFAGTGYYRPLMALTLSIDALASGPFVFHLTSIAWHALAAVLVLFAAETLGLGKRAALVAGVLFAVHPVTTLVADAIAFRSEAMIVVALLGLLVAHEKKRPVLAGLALVAGALTKETALVLAPLFLIALEVSRKQRDLAARKRVFAAEGAALVLAIGMRLAFAPAWRAAHENLSFGDAVGTRLAALAKSVAAVVLPFDRSICDAFAVTHPWQPTAIAGLFALAALAFGAYKRRGVALLLFLAVLPSLQLVPVMRWWSPHYAYVPLAFVAMLVGETVERQRPRVQRAAVAIVVVLAVVTASDGRRYADDASLWTPEVAAQPACREGHFYLGAVARAAKRWDDAAKHYESAIAVRPRVIAYVDRRAALQNLGTVRLEQRRYGDARTVFLAALDGTHDEDARRELTHNLAIATMEAGDPAEAARLLEADAARPDAWPESVQLRKVALERAKINSRK